jgi:hypothetical protein
MAANEPLKRKEQETMKTNTSTNQIVLRDIPNGMSVKTSLKAGLKLDGIKGE